MTEGAYILAHKHSIRNREELDASESCGCFYCCEVFAPEEIHDWIRETEGGGETAVCPYCQIDSVIGSASGYPITVDFLRQMKHQWF